MATLYQHEVTYHCPSVVEPCIGRLEILLDLVVALKGQLVALQEEGYVCQLT